jgi:diacylglycerol kinase family enzyme
MRATVIVNRRARMLKEPGPLLDVLRSAPGAVETSSLAELDRAAVEIARDPPDVVVIAGGDGSVMAGVTALARVIDPIPRIAIAPGGTASTVARNWGYRGGGLLSFGASGAARFAQTLLDAIADDRVHETARSTLRVRDGAGGDRHGFIAGAGLVARFFEEYLRRGAGGYRGSARIVARIFAGSFTGGELARSVLEPAACTITVDGERAPFDRASLVCASVLRDLGLGMRLLYRAGEDTTRVHVVATPLGPARLGPQMPLVLAGRPLLGPKIDALASRIRVEWPAPDAYVLDGELLRAPWLGIEAGIGIRFVTPR